MLNITMLLKADFLWRKTDMHFAHIGGAIANLPECIQQVRIFGNFRFLSGLVYKEFIREYVPDGHLCKPFDVPDDEVQFADFGAIVFDFTMPVEVTSIDLIDVDDNCRYLTVVLTDENGNERMYEVPAGWTNDVTWDTKGWHTLDLTDLYDQPGDIGTYEWTAAWEDYWFDPHRVIQLEITLDGSAAIDNLRFNKYIPIPEPSSLILISLSGLTLLGRRRDRS